MIFMELSGVKEGVPWRRARRLCPCCQGLKAKECKRIHNRKIIFTKEKFLISWSAEAKENLAEIVRLGQLLLLSLLRPQTCAAN